MREFLRNSLYKGEREGEGGENPVCVYIYKCVCVCVCTDVCICCEKSNKSFSELNKRVQVEGNI